MLRNFQNDVIGLDCKEKAFLQNLIRKDMQFMCNNKSLSVQLCKNFWRIHFVIWKIIDIMFAKSYFLVNLLLHTADFCFRKYALILVRQVCDQSILIFSNIWLLYYMQILIFVAMETYYCLLLPLSLKC